MRKFSQSERNSSIMITALHERERENKRSIKNEFIVFNIDELDLSINVERERESKRKRTIIKIPFCNLQYASA